MNKDSLSHIPTADQPVAKKLLSVAEDIQVSPSFQAGLESQLREIHNSKAKQRRGWQTKIIPSLGWAILIIGAMVVLNWAIRSLMPKQVPATHGTPISYLPFKENISAGGICSGQLAVAHDFSVFLSNQDKSGFIELDEGKNIGELRSFAWSQDDGQLAIVGNTRGSGNLYLTSSASDPLQQVLANSELGYLMGAGWSRDGKQLLTWEIENNRRLVLMNKDGTGLTEIDLPVQFFETPQFAPDDESVLFLGAADGSSSGLFQVGLNDLQSRKVSGQVEDDSSFAWSLDGSRLAYIEMDRDLGEARLVVEGQGEKVAIATLPIPKGSSSSIPNSGNLSWSPDGKSLVFEFGSYTADRVIYLANVDRTGLVALAESAHAPAISADGKCLAFIRNKQVFLLDLATAASSATYVPPLLLADLPAGRGSANTQLDKLQWGPGTPLATVKKISDKPTPTPSGTEYDWHGIKLYLDSSLPTAPAQVGIYEAQLDHHATLDSARALAEQFGLNGQIYETPSELGDSDTTDYLAVEGNQHLRVRSNLYFSYYPDYPRWLRYSMPGQKIDQTAAENLIQDFLRMHGFAFPYKVEYSEFQNGYYALPLTPEGLSIHYNHFGLSGFLFRFNADGILAVETNLATYSLVDNFGVISAEDALQKLLNPNIIAGFIEGGHSVSEPIQTWYRPRPENQTITVWGWINSVKSAEGGVPLVTFDGYKATGNLSDLAESTPNTFVEATGQFQTFDGNKVFNVESWHIFEGYEDGLQGTIQRDEDQTVILTSDGLKQILPDIPEDIPLPMENAFVLGVRQEGDVFEWKSIDNRMQGGGGGGGGGGSGFYKPNLTGTPVPLPTAQAPQETNPGAGDYTVQEGDTLSGIAETYGTTVDELMQANGLSNTSILIGQTLVIPGLQAQDSLVGQTIDGQRGTITVTIVNKLDGTQSVEYTLQEVEADQYILMKLEGNNLEALQDYNNHPTLIWGVVDHYEPQVGWKIPVVNVERYEILYPDQHFQILRGTQKVSTIQDETVTLFTTEDGQTYAQANTFNGLVGNEGDQVLVEALVIPDETIAGYPVLQVVNASMAINPKSGQPIEMQATADQPYVMAESQQQPQPPAELTATIESVEMVYFMPDQRYAIPDPTAGPVYIQPAWRFQGHYWDGSEFEILVQALKDEFLLPEVETVEPPG